MSLTYFILWRSSHRLSCKLHIETLFLTHMLFTLANEIKCEMKFICVDFLIISHSDILAKGITTSQSIWHLEWFWQLIDVLLCSVNILLISQSSDTGVPGARNSLVCLEILNQRYHHHISTSKCIPPFCSNNISCCTVLIFSTWDSVVGASYICTRLK